MQDACSISHERQPVPPMASLSEESAMWPRAVRLWSGRRGPKQLHVRCLTGRRRPSVLVRIPPPPPQTNQKERKRLLPVKVDLPNRCSVGRKPEGDLPSSVFFWKSNLPKFHFSVSKTVFKRQRSAEPGKLLSEPWRPALRTRPVEHGEALSFRAFG